MIDTRVCMSFAVNQLNYAAVLCTILFVNSQGRVVYTSELADNPYNLCKYIR